MTRVDLDPVFGQRDGPQVVGMVHLAPLPGSPGWAGSMDAVIDQACKDALTLDGGGIHGVMVENYGDVPFFADAVRAETVAGLTRVCSEVARVISVPMGVNVLRNDGMAAIGIAAAVGAAFVRVNVLSGVMATDQGWIRGRAAEILRLRSALAHPVAILADVFVKHATPPVGLTLADAAQDIWERGGADALIVSGRGTGRAADEGDLTTVGAAVPDAPLWVGSGASPETVRQLSQHAAGILVGSAIQQNGKAGQAVDPIRLARFMDAARRG